MSNTNCRDIRDVRNHYITELRSVLLHYITRFRLTLANLKIRCSYHDLMVFTVIYGPFNRMVSVWKDPGSMKNRRNDICPSYVSTLLYTSVRRLTYCGAFHYGAYGCYAARGEGWGSGRMRDEERQRHTTISHYRGIKLLTRPLAPRRVTSRLFTLGVRERTGDGGQI